MLVTTNYRSNNWLQYLHLQFYYIPTTILILSDIFIYLNNLRRK